MAYRRSRGMSHSEAKPVDGELAGAGLGPEPVGRGLQPIKHVGSDPVERLPALGQLERPRPPLEQLETEVVLEPSICRLMADSSSAAALVKLSVRAAASNPGRTPDGRIDRS